MNYSYSVIYSDKEKHPGIMIIKYRLAPRINANLTFTPLENVPPLKCAPTARTTDIRLHVRRVGLKCLRAVLYTRPYTYYYNLPQHFSHWCALLLRSVVDAAVKIHSHIKPRRATTTTTTVRG